MEAVEELSMSPALASQIFGLLLFIGGIVALLDSLE